MAPGRCCWALRFIKGIFKLTVYVHTPLCIPFLEILASTYGPGLYARGPFIIWKNILSQICSRTIFEMHTAPEAYSKHASEAVCTQMMLLDQEHYSGLFMWFWSIWSRSILSWTISRGQNIQKAFKPIPNQPEYFAKYAPFCFWYFVWKVWLCT